MDKDKLLGIKAGTLYKPAREAFPVNLAFFFNQRYRQALFEQMLIYKLHSPSHIVRPLRVGLRQLPAEFFYGLADSVVCTFHNILSSLLRFSG